MVHPVSIGAVALLLVNDHVLKPRWPGFVSGKLSDVAGLIVLPLLVLAVAQLVAAGLRLPRPTIAFLAGSIVTIGVVYSAGEIAPGVSAALETAWGIVRSPVDLLIRGGPTETMLVGDLSDLLALPALAIAWMIGRGYAADRAPHPSSAAAGARR
jgi:hypothetical protein